MMPIEQLVFIIGAIFVGIYLIILTTFVALATLAQEKRISQERELKALESRGEQ